MDAEASLSQLQNPVFSGLPATSATASVGSTRMMMSSNPMYTAFEDFERQARHRKFMIAEAEDSIANTKKELDEVSLEDKALEIECEKLIIEADAFEVKCEKTIKEKELILAEYAKLSKEMSVVADGIARKQARLKQIGLDKEAKLKQIETKKLEFIVSSEKWAMYRQNPAVADVMDKKETNQLLERQIEEKTEQLRKLEESFGQYELIYPEKWSDFVKNCVKVAEIGVEVKANLKHCEELKAAIADHEKKRAFAYSMEAARITRMGLANSCVTSSTDYSSSNTTTISPFLRGLKLTMSPVPSIKRTSTFKALDRVLKLPSALYLKKRIQESETNLGKCSSGFKYPRRNWGESPSSLIAEIRSRNKGTVLVNPVPNSGAKQTMVSDGDDSEEQSVAPIQEEHHVGPIPSARVPTETPRNLLQPDPVTVIPTPTDSSEVAIIQNEERLPRAPEATVALQSTMAQETPVPAPTENETSRNIQHFPLESSEFPEPQAQQAKASESPFFFRGDFEPSTATGTSKDGFFMPGFQSPPQSSSRVGNVTETNASGFNFFF